MRAAKEGRARALPSRSRQSRAGPGPGIPLNLVHKWLGHAQLATSAIYAGAAGAEEKDIARRMWTCSALACAVEREIAEVLNRPKFAQAIRGERREYILGILRSVSSDDDLLAVPSIRLGDAGLECATRLFRAAGVRAQLRATFDIVGKRGGLLRRIAMLSCTLLLACAGPASAAGPFAAPVKDCHPCRFSPGPGQPTFDLSFVFRGSGDQKALTAFVIVPVDGGQAQHLDVGPLAVADFPDGFALDDADMNFDKLGDLSIVTQEAADNIDAAYWIYEPATKRFVVLERIGDGDNEVVLSPGPDHRLFSRVRGSLVEYTDYAYRISGHRAVAVSTDSREIEGHLIVDVLHDLTVKPNRVTRRTVVGFIGDSPARRAFLKQLDAAATRAEALNRRGNPAGAAAAIAAVVKDKQLGLVTSSYPITGDPGDLTLVRQFNDYGFYLEQAKQPEQAIGVLAQVTDVDANRTVAYLNLADAEYAGG